MARRVPPVVTRQSAATLVAAGISAVGGGHGARVALERALTAHAGAAAAWPTASGSEALALALRLLAGPGRRVAMPAFSCVDLVAAAERAGVRVRVYDIDPVTLGPDLESVRAVLHRGVDLVVVGHLFGYPADVAAVERLAAEHGVSVLEDAAQGAGATLRNVPAGGMAEFAVLSFGRGKGLGGGGGGALLARGAESAARLERATPLLAGGRGLGALVGALAQAVLARPSLYALPSALPFLHLGEMVYHPVGEPSAISAVGAACALDGLASLESDRRRRAEIARGYATALREAGGEGALVQVHPEATLGALRFPFVLPGALPEPALGIVRTYPCALPAMAPLAPLLEPHEPAVPGAETLARHLLTAPTHARVAERDQRAVAEWLGRAAARFGPREPVRQLAARS